MQASWRVVVSTFALCAALAARAADAPPSDQKAIDDFNFAAWLYNSGKFGMAVESYQAFLRSYPDHAKAADARFGLAQSLFHQDQFKEAAEQYETLRAQATDFAQRPEVLFQLGQARVALGQFAEAQKLFADLRATYAAHYLADWAAAREAACLISLNRPKDADPLLDAFLARYTDGGKSAPDKAPATREMLARMEQAGVKAGDAFLNLVERSAFYQALSAYNAERFPDARQAFQSFLARYPDSKLKDEAGFRLAQALYRQNAFAEAAAAYAAVADGPSEFAEPAAFERGLALQKAGRAKEAAAAFARVAERFPAGARASRAKLYAGTFLFDAGDYAGAIERLKPLAAAKAELSDEAAYWLGMSLLKAGRAADAEKQFADGLSSYAQSSWAGDTRLGLGDACLAQNKLAAAAQAFREYARANPQAEQAPRALYSGAVALHRSETYAESDDLCGDFLKRFGAHELAAQVLFLSAENRFLLKTYDRAADQYRAFLERKDAPADRAARAHYRLAWVQRYAKRYDAALEELARMDVSAAGPAVAAEASYLKGICAYDKPDYTNAVAALAAYLKADDVSRFGDDALLKLAVARNKLGQPAEGADALERLIRQFPKSELVPRARYQLGESLYEQKQYGRAAEHYRKLAETEPATDLTPYGLFGVGQCLSDQGKWADAAEAFGKLAARFKGSDLAVQGAYREGVCLTRLGQWADAERSFRALLETAPKHGLARAAQAMLGACLQNRKQWEEAARAFGRVADDYPADKDQARMVYEQAWSWREAGSEKESLAAFQRLADRFPDDPLAADACFYLGEAKYQAPAGEPAEQAARRLDEARALYERVLKVSKDRRLDDKALYRIGWCQWLAGRYQEAAAAFDRLRRDYPNSDLAADALFQGGQSHMKGGAPNLAVERFKELIGNGRYSGFKYLPEAGVGLAECSLILDRPEEAFKAADAFIEKYPKHEGAAQAYFVRARSAYALRKMDAALADFAKVTALTRGETGAQAQFYIGQCHQARGDYKAAATAYLRVQALYADAREWVAASLFEGAKCSDALGGKDEARRALREVADKYKDTSWGPLAAERLK